jgi:hypothetical protein
MYHSRTWELLGRPPSEPVVLRPGLPAAVAEWAARDGERLLSRYSNQDRFSFDDAEVVSTSWGTGLRFCVENQGNFGKVVLLDHGDDPPVVFGWLSDEPWVVHAQRFSDCVFAQIFDWQYLLEDGPDGYPEIGFAPAVELPGPPPLGLLRERFAEQVGTHFVADGVRYDEYRFWRHPRLRLTVLTEHGGGATITVTGEQADEVAALHAELRSMFEV